MPPGFDEGTLPPLGMDMPKDEPPKPQAQAQGNVPQG